MLPSYVDREVSFQHFFEVVAPELRTGDIVVASWPNEQDFGTGVSRCMAHSRTSHVAMIYRPSDCPSILKYRDLKFADQVHESRPLLVQMIAAGECGHRIRRETGGLEVVDFEVYAKDYLDKFQHNPQSFDPRTSAPHRMSVRTLNDFQRTQAFYEAVEAAITKHLDKPFNGAKTWNVMSSQLDMCQGCFRCYCCRVPWLANEQLDSLFCSVLIADIWKTAGLLDSKLIASEMVPAMWDTTRRIQLQQGASLSLEVSVLGPQTEQERTEAMKYPARTGQPGQGGGFDISCDEFGSGGFWRVDVTKPSESTGNGATSKGAPTGHSEAPNMQTMQQPAGNGSAVTTIGKDQGGSQEKE